MDRWEAIYRREQERGLTEKSAVNEKAFIDFIRSLKLEGQTVVEVGTYKGLTAAFLATEAARVITFDLKDYRKYQNWIWHKAGLLDRIEFHQNKSAADIRAVLKGQKIGFAFIDGVEPAEELEKVFRIVKKAKRVLIHNAKDTPKYTETMKFVNKILKTDYRRIGSQSVYWEKKGR